MNDMTKAIVPKSDQLNSDDLIAGPITIKIADVTIRGGQEQPVSIHYERDGGKPYKPCKSMSRVLVATWGPDAKQYIGRSVTLYRDASVKWAGLEVGGIRISHMSDIDSAMTMALTATKGSRKPFTVKPIVKQAEPVAPVNSALKAIADSINATFSDTGPEEAYDLYLAEKDKIASESDQAAMKALLPAPVRTAFGKVVAARKIAEQQPPVQGE